MYAIYPLPISILVNGCKSTPRVSKEGHDAWLHQGQEQHRSEGAGSNTHGYSLWVTVSVRQSPQLQNGTTEPTSQHHYKHQVEPVQEELSRGQHPIHMRKSAPLLEPADL